MQVLAFGEPRIRQEGEDYLMTTWMVASEVISTVMGDGHDDGGHSPLKLPVVYAVRATQNEETIVFFRDQRVWHLSL
jgi:hypothetical protein